MSPRTFIIPHFFRVVNPFPKNFAVDLPSALFLFAKAYQGVGFSSCTIFQKRLTNRAFCRIIKEPQIFSADLGTPSNEQAFASLRQTQGRKRLRPTEHRTRALPAGGGTFLPDRRNQYFFSSSGLPFGGGDSMNYITFEQLMQFSGVVLSLITTIFVILSFNKKK